MPIQAGADVECARHVVMEVRFQSDTAALACRKIDADLDGTHASQMIVTSAGNYYTEMLLFTLSHELRSCTENNDINRHGQGTHLRRRCK